VDDQPDIAADANGPKILVLGLVELVKAHARVRRVHLKIKRSRLDELLLVASQPRQAIGERVANAEFHLQVS
jgi:hypothetical protein